jgi:hypothetical protein
MMCLAMGVFCMSLATLYIPVIVFKARKFAVLFSFGSLFFLSRYEHTVLINRICVYISLVFLCYGDLQIISNI